MKKKSQKKIKEIKNLLIQRYSGASTELLYKTDFELLSAIMLSAQCTDARVNLITPLLFKEFKTLYEIATADTKDIEKIIGSCSFFKMKAKHLKQTAQIIVETHGGVVPKNEELLMLLPGVGQKTAHVFLIEFYGMDFMAVDTHVFRTSHRLGLSNDKSAKQTEETLVKIFKTDLNELHQAFVLFGRYLCKSKKPMCEECFLVPYCISKEGFKPA
ncbi:MAG: hypothetical protein RL154_120 [Pseudomonadota bacterium]|jgi:endonuclease-3